MLSDLSLPQYLQCVFNIVAMFSDVTLYSYMRCIFNIVAILSGLQPSRHQRCHRTNLAPGNTCQDTGSWCSFLSSQGSQFLPQSTGTGVMAMHSCCSEVCLVLVPRLTNRAKHCLLLVLAKIHKKLSPELWFDSGRVVRGSGTTSKDLVVPSQVATLGKAYGPGHVYCVLHILHCEVNALRREREHC